MSHFAQHVRKKALSTDIAYSLVKPLPCLCSANKARTQEAQMLARANDQRKEASAAATTATYASVSISAIAVLHGVA
jgi:hypothetical protein